VEPNEVQQGITLEGVSPTVEVHEKVDKSLDEYKGVGTMSFLKYYHSWKIIIIMVRLFFMISKILSCITSLLRITTFNVFLIETRGRVLLKREGLMQEGEATNQGSTRDQTQVSVDRLVNREKELKTTVDRLVDRLTTENKQRKKQVVGRPTGRPTKRRR